MAISPQDEHIRGIIKGLGLDPGKINRFSLTMRPNEPVTVSVRMFVDEKDAELIAMELKKFHLVERGE